LDFSGKTALVTGGSRGIGKAVAEALAGKGARVAINYLTNKEAAVATLAGMEGGPHVAIQADVSDPESVERLFDEAVAALGTIDIVVNNAGIFRYHRIDEVEFDEWLQSWKEVLDTNLLGPANVCFHAARHMIENGGGRIVNVSSRGAFRGEPEGPAYGASKAGLNAMSQSLALRLAPHNIFVGVVAPGFVETDLGARVLDGPLGDSVRAQSPLNRVARPEEVAYAVLFLASRGSEFSTGTIIDVNGASYLRS
jgi:NAD(P)-dependent dehydrogenase (short-subunit alcohol dehydrogenase family)